MPAAPVPFLSVNPLANVFTFAMSSIVAVGTVVAPAYCAAIWSKWAGESWMKLSQNGWSVWKVAWAIVVWFCYSDTPRWFSSPGNGVTP